MNFICECVESDATHSLNSCPASAAVCYETTYTPSDIAFFSENVTAGTVGYVYAWGVAAVLSLWALGYIIGALKRAVNMA